MKFFILDRAEELFTNSGLLENVAQRRGKESKQNSDIDVRKFLLFRWIKNIDHTTNNDYLLEVFTKLN